MPKKKTYKIDARCANLEAVCYNLIATQSPVASDFRLLQTIIYIDFNLQRMRRQGAPHRSRRQAQGQQRHRVPAADGRAHRAGGGERLPGAGLHRRRPGEQRPRRGARALRGGRGRARRLPGVLPRLQPHRDDGGRRRRPDGRLPPHRHGVALPRPHRGHLHGVRLPPGVPAHRSAPERRRHRRGRRGGTRGHAHPLRRGA